MTFMEVKGQEIKCGKLCVGYHMSKDPLMQAEKDDDLHGGQRSSEIKCGKLCGLPYLVKRSADAS